MKIISSISIRGFRSISDQSADRLGGHTVFIGKNSSGKSNVLRALNLFFNGETSPGIGLDFDKDLHYRPLRRQKKIIQISISFDLHEKFKFRKELIGLEEIGKKFEIVKTWSLNKQRRAEEAVQILVDGKPVPSGDIMARDFLSLIVFRYIPNRTIPADLLRDESQAIAGVIFKKLRESSQAADVLKGLTDSAERLLSSTANALVESGAPIASPNIAAADSLGEMLKMSGFQARGLNGANIRDEDWGAGHQAFFLLNLLREIDTDYSRQFGWRQATVWAVEEPESGLHHDLQTRLAKKFIDWSSDEDRRLQIFTTTHSPVISMSANCGYWVEIGETSSVLSPMETQTLVRAAEENGVSAYLHPVLAYPFNPVVIVEGANDELVLNHVANIIGRGNLKFVSLPSMDDGEVGSGIDSINTYIKKNSKLMPRRQVDSPLMVFADWDVPSHQLASIQRNYGDGGGRYVIRADSSLCRPELGKTFLGLERFYCPEVIRSAHDAGEITVAFPANGDAWVIEKGQLSSAKARLAQRMLRVTDLTRLAPLIGAVEQVFAASVSFSSQQLKLV